MVEQARLRRAVALIAVVLVAVARQQSPSAQSTTWYVATSGTNGTSCGTSASPCATVQYVLDNKVSAGHTIIVNPGTYSGGMTLSNASRHSNITITTTSAVKSALTFNRGIPTGTDNRPFFSAGDLRSRGA